MKNELTQPYISTPQQETTTCVTQTLKHLQLGRGPTELLELVVLGPIHHPFGIPQGFPMATLPRSYPTPAPTRITNVEEEGMAEPEPTKKSKK